MKKWLMAISLAVIMAVGSIMFTSCSKGRTNQDNLNNEAIPTLYSNPDSADENIEESDDIQTYDPNENAATSGGYSNMLLILEYEGDRISYEGEIIDDVPHGSGIAKYKDGSIYEGEFSDGLKHGYGKLTYEDGEYYEGYYENGVRNGYGIYYHANGALYEGNFVNGKRSGYGIYYATSGTRYEGQFLDGDMHNGIIDWPNGDWYEGEFPGTGTYYYNGVERPGTATKTDTGWYFEQ